MESVRPAAPADLDRCRELLGLARAEAAARRGGDRLLERWPEGDGGDLTGWVGAGDPLRTLLVGEFDGAIVGAAGGLVTPRAPTTATALVGRVTWCFVEAPARGVGVGTALLGSLVTWFAGAGCADVEAVALPGDRATKQLYEAGGLKARLLVMHRPLP